MMIQINLTSLNQGFLMKTLAIVFSCLLPILSFADNLYRPNNMEIYQEQCAKEKDPLKRQSSCHMLDQHSESQAVPDFHKETVTV
jgi:hypothetical protein